jgi:hypothetical protein
MANKKFKINKYVRQYRGAEFSMDHFFCTKLKFPRRWKNSKNCNKYNKRNNHLPQIKYKIRLLNYDSIANSMVPEPEGSSPCSQQPTTGHYPESGESNPHCPSQSPKDSF